MCNVIYDRNDQQRDVVMEGKLTVYFDEPFWVGVFERCDNGKLSVCKITFGAEPKEQEIYAFLLRHYTELRFSREVNIDKRKADGGSTEGILRPVLTNRSLPSCVYRKEHT